MITKRVLLRLLGILSVTPLAFLAADGEPQREEDDQYEDINVGFFEVKFTLKQLQDLRSELKNQKMSISWDVRVFMSYVDSENPAWFWVDWADKIKMNENSPEECFAEPPNVKTTFTLFPPKDKI